MSLGRGAFSLQGQPPFAANGAVEWVVGWFNESLPPFVSSLPRGSHVSFLHVDSDLYSSASTIFGELGARRLRPGCVIVFDELFHFPGFVEHEMKALWEFLRAAPHLAVETLGTSTKAINMRPEHDQHPQSAALRLVRWKEPK